MEDLVVSGGKRRSDTAGVAVGGMEGRLEGPSDLQLAPLKQPPCRKSVSFTEDEAFEVLKGDLLTKSLGQGRAHSVVGAEKGTSPGESAFHLLAEIPLSTNMSVTAVSTSAVATASNGIGDEVYCYHSPVGFRGEAEGAASASKPPQQRNTPDPRPLAPSTEEVTPQPTPPPPPSAASLTTMTTSVAHREERLPVTFSTAASPGPAAVTTVASAATTPEDGGFYHQSIGCALGGSSGNAYLSSGNGAAGGSSIASGGLESSASSASENENDVEESPYFSDENCDGPYTCEGENSSAIDDDVDDRAKAWSDAVAANSDAGITLSGSRLRSRRASWEIGDRYKFVRTLGHGSYGEVAQCEDLVEGGLVAVKRVLNVFDSEVDAKRIYREMYILRNMKHEEIIHLKDVILPDHYDDFTDLYLVFEFVDTDMYKLIGSPQFLTDEHVKFFMYQMLVGLKYLHSAHVIHRDIKPANILVNEDCSLKICDFGLSRVVTQEPSAPPPPGLGCRSTSGKLACSPVKQSSSVKTPGDGEEACGVDGQDGGGSGLIGGSPDMDDLPPQEQRQALKRQLTRHVVTRWYRAPELILLQDYNNAVDIWSLGCIMAELLSMQKDSFPTSQERNALFPGKSCFPLSADTPSSYSDALDQLNVIFDVIGTPCETDIEGLGEVRQYLTKLPYKPPLNLAEKYRGASPQALELLALMLRFNPSKRVTVDEALEHPYLSSFRSPEKEVTASAPISMEFENIWTDKATLKHLVYQEVLHYHKDKAPSLPAATSCKTPPSTPSTRSPSPTTTTTTSSVSKKRSRDDEEAVDQSGVESGSGSALLSLSPSVDGTLAADTPTDHAGEDVRQVKRQRSDVSSGR